MEDLKAVAESFRAKLNLQYNAQSVKFIEEYIEQRKGSIHRMQKKSFIDSIGAFLGQCIIETYGGEWTYDEKNKVNCVAITDVQLVYPIGKVMKQFENGLEDSVYSLYNVIPVVFNIKKK